jgi:hypothetical protein
MFGIPKDTLIVLFLLVVAVAFVLWAKMKS